MSNKKTLKPQAHKLTAEERSRGGRNSAQKRKELKEVRKLLSGILTMPIKNGNVTSLEEIKSLASAKGKNVTVEEAFVLKLTQKALSGDYKAMRLWVELMGEESTQTDEKANENRYTLAELLNNPQPDRNIADFEEADDVVNVLNRIAATAWKS